MLEGVKARRKHEAGEGHGEAYWRYQDEECSKQRMFEVQMHKA